MEAAQRLNERRRIRALLNRYPSEAAHEQERAEALAQIDKITSIADARKADLHAEGKKIELEAEFYKKDPSRAPEALRRRVEENLRDVQGQARFLRAQADERVRLNARFDEERARLVPYWRGTSLSTR